MTYDAAKQEAMRLQGQEIELGDVLREKESGIYATVVFSLSSLLVVRLVQDYTIVDKLLDRSLAFNDYEKVDAC